MRILRVAQKYYPDVAGGGAYHVHAMSRDQAATGHDVTVLTVRRDEAPRREQRDGYTVLRREPTVSVLGNDLSVALAQELRRADGYDVVHAHSHLYFATNLAALGRRFDDTPLAITNHGLYSQSAPHWLFDLYLRTLGRATFDSADVVFCYTDTDRERLRELGVATDVAVVANGIDTDRFRPGEPASDDHQGPSLLFVGRLVEGKRPRDAIDALAHVVAEYPDSTLSFAGDGHLREPLQEYATAAGLAEHVEFLGHVDYDDMPGLYRGADLLVLPSESEGLPRTVLEALATETPVVTSDLEQLDALVERGGVSVPVGDAERLGTAVRELLADPARRARLGRAGREHVVAAHNWAATVELTTERLTELVE